MNRLAQLSLASALLVLTAVGTARAADNLILLGSNRDAYLAKLALIRSASRTIDASYFIIEDDATSSQFLLELAAKARAGVRVRLLVDYFMSDRQQPALRALAAVRGVEVKRYRPLLPYWKKAVTDHRIDADLLTRGLMAQDLNALKAAVAKSPMAAEMLPILAALQGGADAGPAVLGLLARRLPGTHPAIVGLMNFMERTHHKLLLANGRCFVMGGRNISDEYHTEIADRLLERPTQYNFQDTDLAGCEDTGVHARSFNVLWASPINVPLDPGPALAETELARRVRRLPPAYRAGSPMGPSAIALGSLNTRFADNLPPMVDSSKAILGTYIDRIRAAKKRVDLVSAYFYVEGDQPHPGLKQLWFAILDARRRGVEVNIYTNSALSTDLNMVNLVAFGTYRRLLDAGVKLFELAPQQGSLHTKSASFDDEWLLVGSFNLDPRSHLKDTNNLAVIHDPSGRAAQEFRKTRIDALRWTPANPDFAEGAIKAKGQQYQFFRLVREFL